MTGVAGSARSGWGQGAADDLDDVDGADDGDGEDDGNVDALGRGEGRWPGGAAAWYAERGAGGAGGVIVYSMAAQRGRMGGGGRGKGVRVG
jgi:hypothetical protein